MSPALTFFFGLFLLILFGWYFATDIEARKRWLGLVLTILVTAFCIQQFWPPQEKIRLGLDLKGGTSFLIKLVRTPGAEPITKDMQNRAVEVIRKRVDALGGTEPDIAPQGDDRIFVQIPDLSDADARQAEAQLKKVAKLEFAIVRPDSAQIIQQIDAGQAIVPPGYVIKTEKRLDAKGKLVGEEKLLVPRRADLGGDRVKRAFAYYDQQGWGISLEFDGEGAKLFDDLASVNKGNRMAILLDGEILSAPSLNSSHYGGRAQITGHFTEREARDLASSLENPLRVPVDILDVRHVSASLGADSIRSGILASITGLILVAVFMVIYYHLVGFVAIVALIINCAMVLGAMGMFHSVLTLPGIAGLILGLGIAVDANVLIYERLREEIDAGKSLRAAVNTSYSRAFSAIFDAHVTQLLTAAILYWLATGPVKGFALTLTIGIIASMFSSLLVTYTCFDWAFHFKAIKKITMLNLIKAKRFDFLGNSKPFMIASIILVIASIAIFAIRGSGNFDADFKGGDMLTFSYTEKLTPDQVRKALAGTEMEKSIIQSQQLPNLELITVRSDFGSAEKIQKRLSEAFPNAGLKFEQIDHIGPVFGAELARKSALALALGMIGIFIYVSLRFETSFAFGSIAALLHDLVVTLGIFALSGRELSMIMVAAFLTIAGYSINDKIVVFDRIREVLKAGQGGNIQTLMNAAINATLSRTILTGGTVLLSVLALFFFGGAVLKDFSFAMLVGVIVGTYSSIFIAAPIVLWWSKLRGKSVRREVLDNEALKQQGA